MLKIKRNQSYFRVILVKIISVVSLIAIVMTFVMYAYFRTVSIDNIKQSHFVMLNQIKYSTENLHEMVMHDLQNILGDDEVQPLMIDSNISEFDYMKSFNQLKTHYTSNPYLHSIYVYNSRANQYINISEWSKRENATFYDMESMHYLSVEQPLTMPYVHDIPISRLNSDKNVKVFSYFSHNYFSDGSINNSVMINLDAEVLLKYISNDTIETGMKNGVQIYDQDFNLLIEKGEYLEELSTQDWSLSENVNKNGEYFENLDHEEFIIIHTKSDIMNWTFVSLIPYSEVTDVLNTILTICLLILIIVITVFVLISYSISKKLYNPIKAMKEHAYDLFRDNHKKSNSLDEFDFIGNELDYASQQLDNLQEIVDSNQYKYKEETLDKLLNGRYNDIKTLINSVAYCNTPLNIENHFAIIIFKIDNYVENYYNLYTKSYQQMLKYGINNISKEIFSESYVCDTLETMRDYVVTIVNVKENDYHATASHISTYCKKIQGLVFHYYKISLSAFISYQIDSFQQLSSAYDDLLELSEYRMNLGHGCMQIYDEIDMDIYTDEYTISKKTLIQLGEQLKKGEYSKVLENYMEIAKEITIMKPQNIKIAVTTLGLYIYDYVKMLEKNRNIEFDLTYRSFLSRLNDCETINQINQVFFDLFSKITAAFTESKNEETNKRISKIKEYIEQNYTNYTLTPEEISDQFNMTSRYLGKIFKEETSESIMSYIKECRIKECEKLLKETEMSVEEILGLVGWANLTYFYTVFKNKYGMTPNEFRETFRV